MVIVGNQGVTGSVLGFALAILPVTVVVATFLWVDRVEPEPISHLAFAFGWGACVSTLVALVFNSLGEQWLRVFLHGGQDAGAFLVAPVVEETVKGLVLLIFLFFRRKEFDGLVDGIVLGGMVAAGFAFTENILYFARAFAHSEVAGAGLGATIGTFVLRGVLSPFAHPLFTAMTGIGCGLAATSQRGLGRVLAPVFGWLVAVLLHATWNYSATAGTFWTVYLLVMVPLFCGMAYLVVWSRRLELKVLEQHLPAYASAGWITAWELPALTTFDGRRKARDWANRALGATGRRAMEDLQATATELAFLRAKASGDDDLYQAGHHRVTGATVQYRAGHQIAEVPEHHTAGTHRDAGRRRGRRGQCGDQRAGQHRRDLRQLHEHVGPVWEPAK